MVVANGQCLATDIGWRDFGLDLACEHLSCSTGRNSRAKLQGFGLVDGVVGFGLAVAHKWLDHPQVISAKQHPVGLFVGQWSVGRGRVGDLVAFIKAGKGYRVAKINEVGANIFLATRTMM